MAKEETKNYVRSKIYTNGNHEVSAQNTVEALDKMIDDSDNVEQQVATLGSKVGDLSKLVTSEKEDLVKAINEAYAHSGGGGGGEDPRVSQLVQDVEDIEERVGDRVATSSNMGYVVLDKDKAFAEQVTKANTIYEIRYAFDLEGGEVAIPEGCTLKFEGGSLKNGTIEGTSTIVESSAMEIFANVTVVGSWSCDAQCEWFGGDIQKTLNSFNSVKLLPNKIYNVASTITFPFRGSISGDRSSVIRTTGVFPLFQLGYLSSVSGFSIQMDNITTAFYISTANIVETRRKRDTKYYLTNSGILVKDINISTIQNYDGNEVSCIQIESTGTEAEGFWGINFESLEIGGGFRSAININVAESAWLTDCYFKRVNASHCLHYVDMNGGGEVKFINCSMQSYDEVTGYEDNLFCKLNKCSNVVFDRCQAWDFNKPCWSIDYSCRKVTIYGSDSGTIPQNIILTGEYSGTLPYRYVAEGAELTSGSLIAIPVEGEKATYSALDKLPNGDISIGIGGGYPYLTWLGLDTKRLRVDSTKNPDGVKIRKNVFYASTIVEFYFSGKNFVAGFCTYNSRTDLDKNIEWVYYMNTPPTYSSIPTVVEDGYYNSYGTISLVAGRIFTALTANIFYDAMGMHLTKNNASATEISGMGTETGLTSIDYGKMMFDRSNLRPVFYDFSTNKWITADGAEFNVNRVTEYRYRPYNKKIKEGFVFYATDLKKAVIATSVSKNEDGTYTSEWVDLQGFSPSLSEGTTAKRPQMSATDIGFQYYDTTLNRPIWWNGSKWVDATGADV